MFLHESQAINKSDEVYKNRNLNIILEDLKTDVEHSDVLHPVDIINKLILDPRTFSKDNYIDGTTS